MTNDVILKMKVRAVMKPIDEMQRTPADKQVKSSNPTAQLTGMASRWTAIIGTLVLGILYLVFPDRLVIGPKWLLLVVEVVLLLPLVLSHLTGRKLPHITVRILTLAILAAVTLALASGVALLVITLPENKRASELLLSAALLWFFNVLVFALWYWETDGGGPLKRHLAGHQAADFMFPQQANGNAGGWVPFFVDYLFLAFTGATALSPADTYPLTRRAKGLMMIEAVLSMSIIVLLAARAVNIL
jgi:uncharacterized membrane protein